MNRKKNWQGKPWVDNDEDLTNAVNKQGDYILRGEWLVSECSWRWVKSGEGSGADDWQEGAEEKSEEATELRPERKHKRNRSLQTHILWPFRSMWFASDKAFSLKWCFPFIWKSKIAFVVGVKTGRFERGDQEYKRDKIVRNIDYTVKGICSHASPC